MKTKAVMKHNNRVYVSGQISSDSSCAQTAQPLFNIRFFPYASNFSVLALLILMPNAFGRPPFSDNDSVVK